MGLKTSQNINFWAFLVFLALESQHQHFEMLHQHSGGPAQCHDIVKLCSDKVCHLALSRHTKTLS